MSSTAVYMINTVKDIKYAFRNPSKYPKPREDMKNVKKRK